MPTEHTEYQERPARSIALPGPDSLHLARRFANEAHASSNEFNPIQSTLHRKAGHGQSRIIALDADGVLLDYHHSYALAWERTFGKRPAIRDATAYWPIDRYDVHRLQGAEKEAFRAAFDDEFWTTVPLVNGVLDACNALVDAGYDLVCVSAIPQKFQAARLKNLQAAGLPIDEVIATGHESVGDISPKACALRALAPVAFVDDYVPYLRGVADPIHRALILREPTGSPNTGPDLAWAHSHHADLTDFTNWWLDPENRR
jgi:hypothetical protein